MSERVRHMNETTDDTMAAEDTTNTATTMADDGQRWDLGTLFPAKGDSRRPPEWLGRALLYIAIAIVVFSFCWRSWGQIAYLVMDIVVSLFLALAVEPVVVPLVKHGWKRAFASLFALVLLAVIVFWIFYSNRLTLTAIHPQLASSRGIPVGLSQTLFTAAIAVVVTLSISSVGLLILNSLLVLPGASARNVARNLKQYHGFSVLFAFLAGVVGLTVSYYSGCSAGAAISLGLAVVFAVTFCLRKVRA